MTMPVRWSLLVILLLFLLSLLALSRISTTSTRSDLNNNLTANSLSSTRRNIGKRASTKTSSLLLHHLQEEEHLRSRNAQILQDLEENDLQLEINCVSPPSPAADPSLSLSLSLEEKSLQEADFELELALEVQRVVQNHNYDSTLLNESPSALQRHLKRRLRNQKRLLSTYKASLHQQTTLSFSSQECVAWRARQQRQLLNQDRQQLRQLRQLSGSGDAGPMALTRFQQFHPNRRNLDPESIFARTLKVFAQKQYTDPNGYVVELDPIKVMAGSRRASTYQNDDIHVLVLDMQWDPEVTVVVGNVLDETIKLRQEGYRPVMLNVGNNLVPGGDYHLDDASNNEADLFRRTTLYQCLDQEPRRSRFYPLPENGGVYCPNQAVFRHGMDRNNEFMDRFEWISVVSVAPIPKMETREKEGGLGGVQFLEGEDDLLRRRILAAMKVGVSQGHDALVLPPHGTDAGQNPAEAIAAIYRSIIGRDFMGGRKRFQTYKKIIMVLDPEEAFKVVNETSSYRPTQPPAITATPLPAEVDTLETSGDTNGTDTEEQNHEENHDDQKKGSSLRRRSSSSEEEDENESLDSKSSELDEQEDKNEDENDQDAEVVETSDDDDSTEEADDQEESTSDDKQAEDPIIDEDAEEVAEDGDEDGDGLLNDNLSPEDEVSESEALQEEQDLEEDVDLSEEALEEDLSDVPIPAKPDTTSEDKDSENEQGQDVDEETGLVEDESSEQDETSNENQEKPEQVVFVPIIETVKDVFERMLEQRSLLIVKNRARGLPDPDNSDTNNMNKSSGNSTETATPSSTIRSAVPTLSSA